MVLGSELPDQLPVFRIDPDWYEIRGRSLPQVLAVRMCGGHDGETVSDSGRRRAVTDPDTGELRFVAASAGDEDPFDAIARCCAAQSDFITPVMPLMEAIFRVFLAKANAPLTAEEIHDELRAWFAGSPRSRYFTVDTVAKLLETDQQYGIRPAYALAG